MTELAGKNVVITGAASGIGRILAGKIAARKGHPILWDIDEPALEAAAADLARAGFDVSTYSCDLRDAEAILRLAGQTLTDHGVVDVLINNAGVVTGKSIIDASDIDLVQTMDVNALAPIRTTRAFLPGMLTRDSGHIVNVSSAAGIVGSARLTDYCASKFALFGFDEALRIDLRRLDSAVRTTIVCPYYADTGMFAGATTRFPWLLPILDADRVAERIVQAILHDRRRVIMPWFVYLSWPLRLLPVRLFDALSDFFGISRSMDHFTGRQT